MGGEPLNAVLLAQLSAFSLYCRDFYMRSSHSSNSAKIESGHYLNFGHDWCTESTVRIRGSDLEGVEMVYQKIVENRRQRSRIAGSGPVDASPNLAGALEIVVILDVRKA